MSSIPQRNCQSASGAFSISSKSKKPPGLRRSASRFRASAEIPVKTSLLVVGRAAGRWPCTSTTRGDSRYCLCAKDKFSEDKHEKAGRNRLEPSSDRMCGSKRFCFMRLRVLIGLFSTGWAWLKGVFAKMAAASPKGILIVVHKKSAQGDEFGFVVSTHDGPTVTQLFQGPSATLLKQLPAAVGGDCPRTPHATANPDALPPVVPPQLTAPQLLDSNESQSRSAQFAMPAKKRRPRPRASRGLTSSRRMGGYRSASRRKRG